MSVAVLKAVRAHLEQLESRAGRGGKSSVEQELAQARTYLTGTKDPKWKNQLLRRIKTLDAQLKNSPDGKDVENRLKMFREVMRVIGDHPEYNRFRKRRKPADK
jgi:hypothetical protein